MKKTELLDLEATYFSKNRVATFSSFSIFEKVAPIFNYDWIINFNITAEGLLDQLSSFYSLCKEKGLIFLVTVDVSFLSSHHSDEILDIIYSNSDFVRLSSPFLLSFPSKVILSEKYKDKTFIFINSDSEKDSLKETNLEIYEKIIKPNDLNIMKCSCIGLTVIENGLIIPDCKSKHRYNCFNNLNIDVDNCFFVLDMLFSRKNELKVYSKNITENDCNHNLIARKNKDENFIEYLKEN